MKYLFFLLFILPYCAVSQIVDLNDLTPQESNFLAQTKQVNQFFRRFNNEEDIDGKRFDAKDKRYRNKKFRKEYLSMLFDEENTTITKSLKTNFVDDIAGNNRFFLDFHGGSWYAEVSGTMIYQGKSENVLMFLTLENSGEGSKWVITQVIFNPFQKLFYQDTTAKVKTFLHPLSHEVDFMNLRKAFADIGKVEYYSSDHYKIDYLSLFYFEIKRGTLKFESINNVKFHILQTPKWYFEISYFNRKSTNSGWLISNILPVDEESKAYLKQKFEH